MDDPTDVEFLSDDGHTVRGYLTTSRGRNSTLALVTHGGNGIPADSREVVNALSRSGVTALAVDSTARLFDGDEVPESLPASRLDVLRSRAYHELILRDLRAGADHVERSRRTTFTKVVVVGFCGGGLIASWLAAEWPRVDAVVALHAAPRFPEDRNSPSDPKPHMADFATELTCKLQLHYGGRDPYVPPAMVEEMLSIRLSRGLRHSVYWYPDRGHGWCNPDSETFSASDAALAVGRVVSFVLDL